MHHALRRFFETSSVIAICAFIATGAHAQTYNIAVTGDIPAIAPADAANGTTGPSATNGVAGYNGATFTGATITGTVIADVTGQKGGDGGDDTNGDAGGTANGGNGGAAGAGITFNAQTSPILVINSGVTVRGGAGGNGGNVDANNGNGGAAAAGGAGVIANSAGAVININGTGAILGGDGNTSGTASGFGSNFSNSVGGNGINASQSLTVNFAGAGTITGGTSNMSDRGVGIQLSGANNILTITGASGSVRGGLGAEAISLVGTNGTVNNSATLGTAGASNGGIQVRENSLAINNTGIIVSNSSGISVTGGKTLTTLSNTGTGLIQSTDSNPTIRISGAVTTIINSVSGAGGIRATTNNAILVDGLDLLDNTNGLITSAQITSSMGATPGTITLNDDLAGATFVGGVIENTGGGNVIGIGNDQTGNINSSSTLLATATTNAIFFNNASGAFVNTGAITGRITSSAHSKIQTFTQNAGGSLTGTGTVIDLNDGADGVILNGGTIAGNVDLGAGNDVFTYANAGSATALNGTLAFGSGTNTFLINESMTTTGAISSVAGSTNVTVAAGKTFTVGHAVNFAGGTFNNEGTTVINDGQSIVANGDNIPGGRYIFGLSNATAADGSGAVSGLLDFSGGSLQSAISSASQIEIQATGGATLTAGAQFRIVHGGGLETTDFTGDLLTDNSTLFNFRLRNGNDTGVTFAGADANDIIVEVISASIAALDLTRNASAVNVVTTAIGGTGGATFDAIQTNLGAAATSAELNELYETLAPAVDNGVQNGAVGTTNQVVVLAETRISGARRDIASGSEAFANRVWMQGFGKMASQDKNGIYDGYDADTYGSAIGIDGLVGDGQSLLGVALSYGKTQIDSENSTRTDTDIDSYQITFYGDRNFNQGSFIEGFAAYARNNIESVRHDVGGVAGLNAQSDYSASTYAVRGGVGHNFALPRAEMKLVPKLTAAYAIFDPETYTETGAGGANLRVDGDTSEQLNLGINVELNKTFTNDMGAMLRPSVNVGYKHDMLSDAVDTTSTFAAGGAAFTTKGVESEKGAFTAGLGMEFFSTGHWQVTAKYDLELKNGYDAHAALVRAGYRF